MASPPESALVGLGLSKLGRYFRRHAGLLARDALLNAAADAGISLGKIDGLLLNLSPLASPEVRARVGHGLQPALGLGDLKRLSIVDSQGATVGQMLGIAATWLQHEGLEAVALVFADTPITMTRRSSKAFQGNTQSLTGIPGLDEVHGIFGGPGAYAMLASRYMHETGVTEEDFARVAVTNRAWAAHNELAFMRTPITEKDYFRSRYVVAPLRLFDCALPVNGGVAVILMHPDRAADTTRKPVYVLGRGQCHRALSWRRGRELGGQAGAAEAGRQAYTAAGLGPADMDVRQLYDPFSFVTLMMLEEYGFCGPGEARHLYADGRCGPGGTLPTNTGGGQSAAFYLQGFTPLVESIVQLRGEAGARQVAGAEVGLTTFCGGLVEHHSCAVLAGERG